jgi:transcriptional regulator with XRE-family HTH domain
VKGVEILFWEYEFGRNMLSLKDHNKLNQDRLTEQKMKVGNKIHKIRELKNITPKDMADRLNITTSGYQKIERDEVSINMDRLLEIADIFEMKPEEVLTFDEKYVFNNINGPNVLNSMGPNNYSNFPEEHKMLYEANSKLQDEKIKLQGEMIEMLKDKIRSINEVASKLQSENELLKSKIK